MLEFWIFLVILFPCIVAGVVFLDKSNYLHRGAIKLTTAVLVIAAAMLALAAPVQVFSDAALPSVLQGPLLLLDFLLLAVFCYIGIRRKHTLITVLAVAQLVGLVILQGFFAPETQKITPAFNIDSLAVTLVLVVSVVGSLVVLYGEPYMIEHEKQHPVPISRRPRFFALMLLFLGAMNGLALADNLAWLFFFWEVTTLCSYLLIAHDDTEEANANACKALWMNLVGGLAFVFALLYLQQAADTLSISALKEMKGSGDFKPMVLMVPMVALCIAGFTKAAQVPFQSWLCGAMVAPTPVSALLHSSTMVKAGVYLVLRLAPIYAGTSVSVMIAVFGAFTFISTAALACGQSNGKKILAYSTISNLGLIIACAGINTPASLAAGMMLLIFHAVSKGLLFLCVGSIEQKIISRDIEDMRGLFKVMPRTALLTTFAVLTMMLPPFGMLLGKWMALESALGAQGAMPVIVTLLALGSGLTVLFWARWAGIMIGSADPKLDVGAETIDPALNRPMLCLAYGAAILSFFAPLVYIFLVLPAAQSLDPTSNLVFQATGAGLSNAYGVFAVYPVYAVIIGGFWYAWRETKKHASMPESLPYMGGMQASQDGKTGFIGPMKGFVEQVSGNYYLGTIFGEDKISKTVNTVGLTLLALLLGGVLQ